MHAKSSLERWRECFELVKGRVEDDEWRHDLARALREAMGCAFVTVHTTMWRPRQASYPEVWDGFMVGLRERFLTRIEAAGEGPRYAIARFGRVYAPLEVARHEEIRSEMGGCLADAGVRGYGAAFLGDGMDGLVVFGDERGSTGLLERVGPTLLGLAEVASATRLVMPAALTPREREVAELVAEGHSNLNAAARLGISEQTVGVHVRAIYRKLGVHSRVELTRWLMRGGR